ncbi:MAG: HU family DNA-binding protein [Spirochaetota bacterium]|nr:HU family DNA-binding protein [Spirochaetota bacterium]
MTKIEIIDKITRQSGLPRRKVQYIVDNFLDAIIESVDKGEKVEIRGFGVFQRNEKKERNVYSPIARRTVDVPARSVLSFKPSRSTDRDIHEGA